MLAFMSLLVLTQQRDQHQHVAGAKTLKLKVVGVVMLMLCDFDVVMLKLNDYQR